MSTVDNTKWIAVVKKETEETESGSSANGKEVNKTTKTTRTFVAFHNDKLLKAGRIAQVKKKIANGQLKHGTYGEKDKDGVMRGCAVFVTTCQSSSPHGYYETELGVPIALAKLEDVIFEGLSAPHDSEWPVKFLQTIPVGADLSLVNAKFQYWLIQENLKHEALWREHDKKDEYTSKVVDAINQVAKVLKQWAETGIIDESAALAARSAASAESAAYSAESAAASAESAAAYSAAASAESAARSAAWSAAYSAGSAAESTAYSAESAESAARSAALAAYSARSAAESAAAYSAAASAAWSAAWSAAYSAGSAAYSAWSAAYSAGSAAGSDMYLRMSEKLLELLAQAPIHKENS